MQLENFFNQRKISLSAKTLVVATSGGPDSMALLDMLYKLRGKYNFRLVVAHLDHQLRPDAHREIEVINQYCQNKEIAVVNEYWPVEMHPEKGIEAAARAYRYSFLLQTARARHADYLLTAHHLDDLIENILLKFIRSGNPSEMNNLQAISHFQEFLLLRPLLSMEKVNLLAYDKANHIPFVIDQTNGQDDVLRNRLRHNVVPLLKKENPLIGRNALRFSNQINLLLSLVAHRFDQLAQPEPFVGVSYRLPISTLSTLSRAEQISYWQYFIWRTWHRRVNENLSSFKLISYQGYFYLCKNKLPVLEKSKSIKIDYEFSFNQRRLIISRSKQEHGILIDCFKAPAKAKFSVGLLAQGEKLPLKNGHHVLSKKKFAENSIPNLLRPYCLSVYANGVTVYVEHTYHNQLVSENEQKYYIYATN